MAIIEAASGSDEDLQTAVDGASTGDIVLIPAGTFNYNAAVNINAGIHLRGSGSGQTILEGNGGFSEFFIEYDLSNGERIEISDIHFHGQDDGASADHAIRLKSGTYAGQPFRIWNCIFEGYGEAAITPQECVPGVIYECTFLDNYTAGAGIDVEVDGDDTASWGRALDYGSANAVYIEDCISSGAKHFVSAKKGARYVARYNTVTTEYTKAAFHTHGKNGWGAGLRSVEVYENVVTDDTTDSIVFNSRGGHGYVYNNELTNTCDSFFYFQLEDSECGAYPCDHQVAGLYLWDNLYNTDANGSAVTTTFIPEGDRGHIVEDTDFFFVNGVGVPGYTAYTYPHPLRYSGLVPRISGKAGVNFKSQSGASIKLI